MGDAEQQREILLAEDSPADANLVRVALREYGRLPCRLHVVADGERALAFLRQQGMYARRPRPDLLLLDIGLPKVGSWQVLKALRTTPALARIPVVMLSEAMMEDEVQQAMFPPQAYFVKSLLLRES
jgi:CheY-like chemotaxis protein